MKIHGWCETCHRVRRVEVNQHGLVMATLGRPATGECDECRERREGRLRPSSRSRTPW